MESNENLVNENEEKKGVDADAANSSEQPKKVEFSESTKNLLKNFQKIKDEEKVEQPTITNTPASTSPNINTSKIEEAEMVNDDEPTVVNAVKAKNKIPNNLAAELTVGFTDTVQTLLFTFIERKKAKKRLGGIDGVEEAEKLYNSVENKTTPKNSLTPQQKKEYRIYKTFIENMNRIPMTDDEYATLNKPIAQLFTEMGIEMPPIVAVLLAAGQIVVSRASTAVFD